MRKRIFFGAMLLVASCTVQKEEEFENPAQHRYHAVAEEAVDAETRVFTDSKLRVRWNEGDHISIFERNTYNQEFEFLGDTGDTAGDFDPVESSGYHSSGDIEDGHVYAVYPYEKKNKCDFDGKLTVTFPSVQHYKKDSFGVGANVMVAKTNTLDLRFMHVGGYRTFKLYGEGVSVSSVKIESNGDEFLSGRTDVNLGSDGKPAVSFIESTSNSKTVELVCDTPVALGSTASEAVEFWFVLPPVTLAQGFTVTITDSVGNEFIKSTSNSIEIKSGVKKSMAAFEVEVVMEEPHPKNVIYYTSSDGGLVTPYNTDSFGVNIVSNTYDNGQGVMVFDGNVTSIGHYAFRGCTNLTSIFIPSSVTSIGDHAFYGCENLTSFAIPTSVTSIGGGAFSTCKSLTSVVIPNGVTSIENGTFQICSSLTSIVIPESVTSIGQYAFRDCKSLTSVVIPNGVTSIENGTFQICSSLTSIVIPESVTSIGQYAFADCSSLTSVIIPEGLTSIDDEAFYHCTSLVSINIPERVSYLGSSAFGYCSSLTSIVIPESVTSIYGCTFEYCTSLTSIVIPESVTSIWVAAFRNCANLTAVYCLREDPPTGGLEMFYNTGCLIYVPAGSVEAYKSAQYWRDYSFRIQAIPNE